MRIYVKEGQTGYDAIGEAIKRKYGEIPPDSLVVQLRTKHREEDKWCDLTELLIQEGDYGEPRWIWENDWWEGEKYIDLIAVARVWEIDISEDFNFEE